MTNTHPAKHSESLANGMAKTTLRDIDALVTKHSDRLYKTLRRQAASRPTTKKGAKKLMLLINKQLAPLAVTAISIHKQRTKSMTSAWLLPHIVNKQLQLSTHIVEQTKDGNSDVSVSPSVIISTHAIARLMQRDVILNDVDWPTLQEALGPLVSMLWPIVVAHRMAGHKQFALLTPRGMFVGTFEDGTGLPVVRTYIDAATMSRKWQLVRGGMIQLAEYMEELATAAGSMLPELPTARERMLFLIRACALGLSVEPMQIMTKSYYEYMRKPDFDWMKEET